MQSKYKRLKSACYITNLTMSVVGNLSPVLFLTLRDMYSISYSLLGFLVLINFVTQLSIDLVFSFFSHKFNMEKTVKATPFIAACGLIIYAVWPFVFPSQAYWGLVLGTLVFSASGGLVEVLLSPVIAAIPAEDPDKEVTKLHSVYAWGVVGMILISTLFLLVFGQQNWQYLVLMLALLPLTACVLFSGAQVPKMETPQRVSGALKLMKNRGLWLCVLMIFLGGASECTMAQWCSGYVERALGIAKVWGDIFGVAFFAMMLGLGRTLYAHKGKNITRFLFMGVCGATVCYFVAAVSNNGVIGLLACGCTGLCVSMLWPGSLIVAGERIPAGGVFMYAIMAAGGDLGASIGPQLIGVITDAAIAMPGLASVAEKMGMLPDQLGMKLGMLVGMLFPLAAIPLYYYMHKSSRKAGA